MEPASSLTPTTSVLKPRGFTLVEMIVVLAIIVIVTAIAVTGQSTFNNSLLLTDTAYTVALSFRQAQTYGLSSKTNISGGANNFGYGIHVASAASITSYILFSDTYNTISGTSGWCPTGTINTPDYKVGNCVYDTSPSSEKVQQFTFSRGFTIKKFCGKMSGTKYCSDDAVSPLTALDVVFIRPNTESVITGFRNGFPMQLTSAEVYLSADSTSAVTRGICVSQVGQVSIASSTCP